MSNPVKTSDLSPASASDSLLGMALAQAFTGYAFGESLDPLWDAGEIASAVYEDRCFDKKRTNGRVYQVGVSQSLAGDFTSMSLGLPSETALWRDLAARWMTPVRSPALVS